MTQKPGSTHTQTSFLATLGAVAWSIVGLRRKKDFERDVTGLNPFYVLGAALIGVGLFIGALLLVVRAAVS